MRTSPLRKAGRALITVAASVAMLGAALVHSPSAVAAEPPVEYTIPAAQTPAGGLAAAFDDAVVYPDWDAGVLRWARGTSKVELGRVNLENFRGSGLAVLSDGGYPSVSYSLLDLRTGQVTDLTPEVAPFGERVVSVVPEGVIHRETGEDWVFYFTPFGGQTVLLTEDSNTHEISSIPTVREGYTYFTGTFLGAQDGSLRQDIIWRPLDGDQTSVVEDVRRVRSMPGGFSYFQGTFEGTDWCVRRFADATSSCVDGPWSNEDLGAGAHRVSFLSSKHMVIEDRMFSRDGRHMELQLPGQQSLVGSCVTDENDDLVCNTEDGLVRIDAELNVHPAGNIAQIPAKVQYLSLTPTHLFAQDARTRDTETAGQWSRSLGGNLGAETSLVLPGRASPAITVSGRRMIANGAWYDAGQFTREPALPAVADYRISGPYTMGWVDPRATAAQPMDAWGRIYARGAGLVFGSSVSRAGELQSLVTNEVLWRVPAGETLIDGWGPFMVTSTAPNFTHSKIINRLTGSQMLVPDNQYLLAIGDGVAVSRVRDSVSCAVFDLVKMSPTPEFEIDDCHEVAVDGDRLAWSTGAGEIKTARLAFAGDSPAYLLGVMDHSTGRSTSAPWQPEFDFTRPLAAGQLVIRNSAGQTVRTLATPASPDGGLRGLSWDTRDDSGAAAPNGTYTWELIVKDAIGRPALANDLVSAVEGSVEVANSFTTVMPIAPVFADPCSTSGDSYTIPEMAGVEYRVNGAVKAAGTYRGSGTVKVTAVAKDGYTLTGISSWTKTFTNEACTVTVTPQAPVFTDQPGTDNDTVTVPSMTGVSYLLNGRPVTAGTHKVSGTVTVVAQPTRGYALSGTTTWTKTFSAAKPPTDIYTEEGEHLVNGRRWKTSCEPYSATTRCRTDIWATTVAETSGRFVVSNDWAFNNLTYVASPRAIWKSNPLGGNGVVGGALEWTTPEGRKWRTECDTALTGRGGCRSFIEASVIESVPKPGGGYSYRWATKWLFNNMVHFK